ncbi:MULTISPECIES: NF038129 family PEP-CTERM protein [unclassified Duganella]|uniref:NF038129 family PEP-CTERM protein n=1 Tax=unclassified Duganella TaxID=2636909 RepID=UPI000E355299|nr:MULTISPECIES: NF038129 family PEP-CTERM protein [unclassified Duganella]RFP09630.1 PEP-CTERM sorting domain-containing protein [Duganella sp. BJB475]RFP27750.1 PEP-CTERM sorting domain-containing protein [Duganella sp. BJB476]
MFKPNFSLTLRHAALALALSACAGLASAQTLHVELNTASLGSSGFLDLQFNPANTPAIFASATISHLTGFGDLSGVALLGDVQQHASGFSFGNTTDYNDLFQAMSFGGKVGFDVTFGGLSDPSPAAIQSKFAVSFYGADRTTVLGNANPDGSLMSITWQPTAGAGALSSDITDHAVGSISAVPEPSAWAMLGAGLALVGFARRRKLAA